MNDKEVKLVDELVAVGLTRDWLVDSIETPDVWTIDRAFAFPFSALREHVAWHMGRQSVHEAVEPLIAALRAETDAEAMRAILWSLGVLRDPGSSDVVRAFVDHDNPLIAAAARAALSKLCAV